MMICNHCGQEAPDSEMTPVPTRTVTLPDAAADTLSVAMAMLEYDPTLTAAQAAAKALVRAAQQATLGPTTGVTHYCPTCWSRRQAETKVWPR